MGLEILLAFLAPWLALLWAFIKLRDDPLWSIILSVAGAIAGVAGVLIADASIQNMQLECTMRSIIHNVSLPCDTQPQPLKTLGFATLLGLIANLIMFGIAAIVYSAQLTNIKIEEPL